MGHATNCLPTCIINKKAAINKIEAWAGARRAYKQWRQNSRVVKNDTIQGERRAERKGKEQE